MSTETVLRLRKAIQDQDVDQAWAFAHELKGEGGIISLGDSRDLMVLLARAGDDRFEAVAKRWLERLAPKHSEQEVRIARAAIDGLTGPELQSHRCEQVLLALFSFPEAPERQKPPPPGR